MQCNAMGAGARDLDHRWYWSLVMILAGVEQWQAAGDCNYLCIWKYKEREQNTICCSGRGRLRLVCFIDFSAISFLGGMSSEYCICCTAQPSSVSDFQYDFYNFHSFPTFLLAGEKPPWTPGSAGGRGRRRILYIIRNLDHHRNWFLGEQWFPGWERWDTAAGM